MDTDRQTLHLLVDRLPEDRIAAALSLLEQIGAGEVDAEPLSEEEQNNVLAAEADRAAGGMIPWEKVRAGQR